MLRQYHLSPVWKIQAVLLEEAHQLALAAGEFQRLAPVASARAEEAWLAGDLERC